MENKKINRRNLFKGAGVTAAALFANSLVKAEDAEVKQEQPQEEKAEPKFPMVDKRQFGNKELKVAMLSLGGMFDIPKSQMLLRKAVDFGVTYWDTANGYQGGNSELGIGMFLEKNPDIREKLFIVTKASGAKNIEQVEEKLQLSLERMKTKYVDLYYGVHGLNKPEDLTDELKEWAKSAKERGLIKYFGFSTHSNMANCLSAASEIDWIDGIMTTYNYEYFDDENMQAAIDKCHKKGIALIAMKTQAKGVMEYEGKSPLEVLQEKGFTPEQAKLKVVWEDKRFCAICSQMPNFTILLANVAAAMDKTKLDPEDIKMIRDKEQANGFCAGCEMICAGACPDMPYVRDVMRCLMYNNNYNDPAAAKETFGEIPYDVRKILADVDYSAAEQKCPRNLPIANLMKEAHSKFA